MKKADVMMAVKNVGIFTFDTEKFHVQILNNGLFIVVKNDLDLFSRELDGEDVDPVLDSREFSSLSDAVDFALSIKD